MRINNIFIDKEYFNIIKDYYNSKPVQTLKNIPHHKSSNRLEHSLKVSYKAYKIAKKHNLDYESTAIAGLLHDLYFNRINDMSTYKEKIELLTNNHPKDAVENAKKHFSLNKKEEDIILTHMWPISKYVPKYKESFVVGYADKACSFKDALCNYQLLKNKLSYNLGVYLILFFVTRL